MMLIFFMWSSKKQLNLLSPFWSMICHIFTIFQMGVLPNTTLDENTSFQIKTLER